ncbi:MAG: sugar phosphate isomerase/epimerase [Caldilineaceae bacterium]|nr:sugar phosphate isomerase/epimerase [Caldilineaceae bacterium]
MTTVPRLAVQVYTLRHFIKTLPDFAATMHQVRAIGYTGVQLDLEHHPDLPAAAIKQICDDEGLTICISHFDYDLFVNDLAGIMERQRLWACPHTAIVAMPGRYHEQGAAGYQRFAAEATAIGERLAAAGITLSYHNHSYEFVRFGAQTGLALLLAESDPRYLWAEIDTYWVQHGGGDPAAWIRQVAGRMAVVHYKDMVMGADGKQTFAEVGQGNLHWPAIVQATWATAVPWIVVEQDHCQRDPLESITLSYQYLQRFNLAAAHAKPA